jgi:hypothetical protein
MSASCPKDGSLVRLFMNETSPRETERLLRHLASCARCSFRFGVLRQVKRDLGPSVEAFAGSLEANALGPDRLVPPRRPIRMALSLRLAAGFLAAVAVVAAGSYLAVRRIHGYAQVRSPSPQLTLLAPSGEISNVPASFRWTPVLNAENYFLELTDDSLRQVFTISTFLITEAEIPREVRSGLVKGRPYVWSVTAHDGDGALLSSRSGSFVIR